MKFTFEETIRNHREMWLWISQKIMEDAKHGIARAVECYKRSYKINVMKTREYIRADCFCCHYSHITAKNHCDSCPLYWNDRKTENVCYAQKSYYYMLHYKLNDMVEDGISYKDAKRCATLAYKIAMLPIREEKCINLTHIGLMN